MTANAMKGSKEFFIQEGLDDYISKPIEIKSLIDILKRWLPKSKIEQETVFEDGKYIYRQYNGGNDKATKKYIQADKLGLDVSFAIQLAGDESQYVGILRVFQKAISKKIDIIRDYFDQGDINNFRIEVHALKSATASIGANSLFMQSKKIELLAKGDKVATIEPLLKPYLEDIQNLVVGIDQLVEEIKEELVPEVTEIREERSVEHHARKALVVSTGPRARKVIELTLMENEIDVDIVSSAKAALDRYKNISLDYYDFILVSRSLFNLSGLTLAKIFRNHMKVAAKIFIMTDFTKEEPIPEEFTTYIDGFINKGIEDDQVLKTQIQFQIT